MHQCFWAHRLAQKVGLPTWPPPWLVHVNVGRAGVAAGCERPLIGSVMGTVWACGSTLFDSPNPERVAHGDAQRVAVSRARS
jgi:hypothetical protein